MILPIVSFVRLTSNLRTYGGWDQQPQPEGSPRALKYAVRDRYLINRVG
jgi:hypothetical protein